MKKITIFFTLVAFTCSCTFYGITNDYNKFDENNKLKIKKLDNFENLGNDFIYEINAFRLKEELTKYPKAMVYVFANSCSSESCMPLAVYELFAETNGCKLFLIMNGYANLSETLNQNISSTLFSIDAEYYQVRNRGKYTLYFENELMELPHKTKQKKHLGSIFFFEFGKFKNVCLNLPEKA